MTSTFSPYLELFKKALSEELRKVVEVAVDTGMVTSATSTTLTDTSKNWPTDQWKDYVVEITSGKGAGQIRKIVSNTSDTLTVDPPWTTIPDNTSRYAIRFVGVGAMSVSAWGGTALTGRDVTQDLQKLQNLDITLSAHKDAIVGTGTKTLSDLDSKLGSIDSKVATETTLQNIRDRLPESLTSSGNLKIAIQEDALGLLKDGGNINVANFPSDYPDSQTHSKLDTIHGDLYNATDAKNVYDHLKDIASKVATEATLAALKNALSSVGGDKLLTAPDNPSNLDIKLSTLDSDLKSDLPRMARLQIYDSGSSAWKNVTDQLPVELKIDSVGLAKETTLNKLINALASVDTDKLLTTPDNPPNLDAPLSDVKSLLDKLEDALSSVGADKIRIDDAGDSITVDGTVNVGNFPTDYPDSGTQSRLDDLKGALGSVGTDKFRVSVVDSLPESPFNITKVAGTALTGRDWSSDFAKLQNLDIKLSEHRDALKPSRSTPTQDLSSQSIAAGGVAEITKSSLDGWSAVVVTVKATYDASATAGVRVRWLYSPDGTNFDSPEDAEDQGNYEDLSFSAGATRQRTVLIPIFQPHVKIQIVNLDSSYAVTVDTWTTLMR